MAVTDTSSIEAVAGGGLRERKKKQTRSALSEAALRLFEERGIDETTVEDIAAAAHVSPRTFFRYFDSKDDVFLSDFKVQLDAACAALAARPEDESLVDAIRRAYDEVAVESEDATRRRVSLAFSTPSLVPRALELQALAVEELGRIIGKRLGLDPAADVRPYLAAHLLTSAVQTATVVWFMSGATTPIQGYVTEAMELVAPALRRIEGR